MTNRLKPFLISPKCKALVDRLENAAPLLRKWHRFEYEEHFFRVSKWSRMFRGVYNTVEEARRDIPASFLVGFDNPAGSTFMGSRCALRESDYPILFWLGRLLKPNSSLLDFGGYLGVSFFAYERYLAYPPGLRWIVYDVDAVVEAGRKIAEREGRAELTFLSNLNGLPAPDILLAAGSIHFLDQPFTSYLAQLSELPRIILINKLPLWEGEPFVTLHNMGPAMSTYQIFNRPQFIKSITDLGYELKDSWENADFGCYIPFHPEHAVHAYSGLLFQRNAAR